MRPPLVLCILVCGLTGAALASGAAPARDPASAEVLFQEARELLKAGDRDAACPKFMESQRLDPATGTLIAVASCHEQEGLLATAWSEYTEAAGRAKVEGRLDRVRLAQSRADAILPRLSKATIGVSEELAALEGLAVERDGIALGPMSMNRPLPIDPGEHIVRLQAPGYASVNVPFTIGGGAERVRVELPMLQRQPKAVVATRLRQGSGGGAPARVEPLGGGLAGTQKLGVWMGSAGVASLAVAGGYLVSGLNKKREAAALCDERRLCVTPGDEYLDTAVTRANIATYFAVGGWALLAAGVTLYVVGDEAGPRSALVLQGHPGGGASVQWQGGF